MSKNIFKQAQSRAATCIKDERYQGFSGEYQTPYFFAECHQDLFQSVENGRLRGFTNNGLSQPHIV